MTVLGLLGVIFGYIAPVIAVGIYNGIGWGIAAFVFPWLVKGLGWIGDILLLIWAYFCIVAAFAVMGNWALLTLFFWGLLLVIYFLFS